MNAKSFLAILTVVCIIAVVQAQSSANPIESLQSKASSVAASATNTSPSAPSNTNTSAGFSLGNGLSSTILMQGLVLLGAFVASSLLA
ncbi:uncharacterized protein B0P05DRAFT_551547 [Gilbertella persicaria]|uniref:uncharacterized protein n=1 Tax=Gilbertella persicaria TaxID=101096 RepID=UPI00221F957C|nr:uncharacterized protein B0P05DRAFT_551547 [Gilbertella persicaria]KAI8069096.1 hypothetical protein B0P05DRAFT_551547 [Gilbertella persicaria]